MFCENEKKDFNKFGPNEPKWMIIGVSLSAPNPSWSILIESIYMIENELWVISRLSQKPGMVAQVITPISDKVRIQAPSLPVSHFILGKTWGWKGKEPYHFIASENEINEALSKAQRLEIEKVK